MSSPNPDDESSGGGSAVILSGVLQRSLKHCIESLRSMILEPLSRLGEVEVFFHSWDVRRISNPRTGECGTAVDPAEILALLPEARGRIDSQEDFDRIIRWDEWFERNPFGGETVNGEEARATLMNFRRAIESQERAWKYFESHKTRRFKRVIVTRADLRFLVPLQIPGAGEAGGAFAGTLWVPRFHGWGGLNDRFALGDEKEMGVYCQRSEFVDGWLAGSPQGNSEQLLMQWLRRNRIHVSFLDFVFHRIRANGTVADRDRDTPSSGLASDIALPDIQRSEPTKLPSRLRTTRERFLILGRQASPATARLKEMLSNFGTAEVILDRPGGDGLWYSDDLVAGFGGLMSASSPFPLLTAWSRGMLHLSQTLADDEAVWFVEDDVAGNCSFFEELVRATALSGADFSAFDIHSREEHPGWDHWQIVEGYFPEPWRSFKPLSRKSARLVRAALEWREQHGCFAFHEALFPTLAKELGMRCLDWRFDSRFDRFFPAFRFRPTLDAPAVGICHPVKEERLHAVICSAAARPSARPVRPAPVGMPRFSMAVFAPDGIRQEEYAWIVRECRRIGCIAVLEVGSGDSTFALLDAGCRVLTIEPDGDWAAHVRSRIGDDPRVEFQVWSGAIPGKAGLLIGRPDFVLFNAMSPSVKAAVSVRGACENGLQLAGRLLIHGSCGSEVELFLAEQEAAGCCVRRVPTSCGMAWVESPTALREVRSSPRQDLYQHLRTTGWYSDDLERWTVWFAADEPVKVLEVGGCDGVGACLLLDKIFVHPGSEVHCVEDFMNSLSGERQAQGMREVFEANVQAGGHERRVHLYEGDPSEALAWMAAGEGYWESFDMVHLVGQLASSLQLLAASMSWPLLKPGGVIVFDVRTPGADAFSLGFAGQVDILFQDRSVAFRKLSGVTEEVSVP